MIPHLYVDLVAKWNVLSGSGHVLQVLELGRLAQGEEVVLLDEERQEVLVYVEQVQLVFEGQGRELFFV